MIPFSTTTACSSSTWSLSIGSTLTFSIRIGAGWVFGARCSQPVPKTTAPVATTSANNASRTGPKHSMRALEARGIAAAGYQTGEKVPTCCGRRRPAMPQGPKPVGRLCVAARNLSDHLCRVALRRMPGDVGLRDDSAARTAGVDHDDPTNLLLFHHLEAIIEARLWRHGLDGRRHAVSGCQQDRVQSFGYGADGDIAVGDDADRPPARRVFDDRDLATIVLDLQARDVRQAAFWSAARRVGRHDVLDLHRLPPAIRIVVQLDTTPCEPSR